MNRPAITRCGRSQIRGYINIAADAVGVGFEFHSGWMFKGGELAK